MARKTKAIVADIRATRARLGHEVGEVVPVDQVVEKIRRKPLLSLAASFGIGLLAGGFAGRPRLRRGRDQARSLVRSQLVPGLGAVLAGAVGPRLAGLGRREGSGDGHRESSPSPRGAR